MLLKLAGGREMLFAGQKSGVVYALDPDRKGEIVWQTRVGKGSTNGGVQWGMASDGQNIYAAVSDVARIRRSNPDPTDPNTALLDPNQGGGLTALRAENGEKIWYAAPPSCGSKPGCSPAQPGAVQGGENAGAISAMNRSMSRPNSSRGRKNVGMNTVSAPAAFNARSCSRI